MKCPVDGTTLMMAERQGVEIDFCPTCRGVWLDRGELDKILERSVVETRRMPEDVTLREPVRAASGEGRRDDRSGDQTRATQWRDDDDEAHRRPHRKRRDSFLSDLFDF